MCSANVRVIFKGDDPIKAFMDLTRQLAQPNSTLMNGTVARRLTADQTLRMTVMCPVGTEPSIGRRYCNLCPKRSYSSTGAQCTPCPEGQVGTADRAACSCDTNHYDPSVLHIQCVDTHAGISDFDTSDGSALVCRRCSDLKCVSCTNDTMQIHAGHVRFQGQLPTDSVAIFTCTSVHGCFGEPSATGNASCRATADAKAKY
eukprot:COSAG01_NODE_25891_length_730_cov_0.814580_2_plen_201_part_01